ncbi:hypothetical protein LaLC_53290 [Bacillus anthracis]|nr:hypothetical protein BAA_A0117 [Bacillus anthracis str. A0248]EDR90563.1 hypothetical protein BAH_A0058 [Bacillus anthracis str. A0442]EDT17054.1 hypothetical protein BAM_A0248 [Bacillus anthracis str. A0465]BAR79078.1 hypothetical protein BASH2_pXO10107 [Bacillus anthracis]GAO62581.1 hypothetical protein BAN44_5536 [Bacillus anthracis]
MSKKMMIILFCIIKKELEIERKFYRLIVTTYGYVRKIVAITLICVFKLIAVISFYKRG